MRTKPRILLDVDGIIADFAGAAAKLMSSVSGRVITPADIIHWEVTNVLEEQHMRDYCKEEIKKPGFCTSLEVYEGALESVAEIQSLSEVFYVTAPMHTNPTWMPERVAWLEKVLGADPKHIIFAYKKHVVVGEMLVDDSPDNIRDWLEHNPSGVGLLWTRPYNAAQGDQFERVSSWSQVLDEVKRISERVKI